MKDERNGKKCFNMWRAELQDVAGCHSRNNQLINRGLCNLPVSKMVGKRKRRLYGSSGSGHRVLMTGRYFSHARVVREKRLFSPKNVLHEWVIIHFIWERKLSFYMRSRENDSKAELSHQRFPSDFSVKFHPTRCAEIGFILWFKGGLFYKHIGRQNHAKNT